MLLSCPKIDCPGTDFPITNYTSEGVEPLPPFFTIIYDPPGNPPIDQDWRHPGCLYLYVSYISQEDADLGALRQSILCTTPPGEDIWYSAPATCCVTCPDGTEFCYTVPAGTFVSRTYAEALFNAQQYACQQAELLKVCFNNPLCPNCGGGGGGGSTDDGNVTLGQLPRCSCVGVHYSGTIEANGAKVALTWAVVGSIPPGLTFVGSGTGATIIGIPTVAGTYAFQVIATNPVNGSYSIRTFTIVALEVSTTSLPTFTIGTPYSEQLLASGGSGNYNWRVATGTLPDGLTLSLTGLISGTPTAGAGGDLTFEVADITCEAISQSFIPPRVTMSTVSTTRIAQVLGFFEFVGSSPPKKYKRADYSGAGMSIYSPVADVFHAGTVNFSKYALFSGYDQIDINGNVLSRHRKDIQYRFGDLNAAWTPAGNQALLGSSDRTGFIFELIYNHVPDNTHRYSLTPDPGSAAEILTPNYPVGSPLIGKLPVTDSEHVAEAVEFTLTDPGPAIWAAIPNIEINGILNKWVNTYETYDYTVVLSDEYTDADALSVATVYTGNLRVASNLQRVVGYTSRFTSVIYSLNLTNLVVGSSYVAGVTLVNTSGAHVVVPYAFTASATTHTIVDSVPTPAAGFSIEVRLPTVAYATP